MILSFQRSKGKEAHLNAFREDEKLEKTLVLVEDLLLHKIENLNSVQGIIVVPWQIKGIDGDPCMVIKNKIKKYF